MCVLPCHCFTQKVYRRKKKCIAMSLLKRQPRKHYRLFCFYIKIRHMSLRNIYINYITYPLSSTFASRKSMVNILSSSLSDIFGKKYVRPSAHTHIYLSIYLYLSVYLYVCMYKGGPKTGPCTATFNDLLCNLSYFSGYFALQLHWFNSISCS
jgi:hypothetical protein